MKRGMVVVRYSLAGAICLAALALSAEGAKLCVANDEVISTQIAEWRAKGRPEVLEAAEADGFTGYCRCEKCRALDAELPGERFLIHKTDRYLNYWNRLTTRARELRPDVKVTVRLHNLLRHPPRRERVAHPDNLQFIYVPTYLDDPVAEIRAWKKAGLRHFCVRPKYLTWRGSLPIAREQFICDIHAALRAEGCMEAYFEVTPDNPATDFERYAAERLRADPTLGFDAIERDWCARFGAAAETVRAYYARRRARCDKTWREMLASQRRDGDEYLEDGHYVVRQLQLHSLNELIDDVAYLERVDPTALPDSARENFQRLLDNVRHYPLAYRALLTQPNATQRRGEAIASSRAAERFENTRGRSDSARRGPLASLADDRVETPLAVPLKRVGTLKPRRASEIHASAWTLGCETIERGYADFWQYADYLDPLGIKTIRLQAGWARCEPQPGRFDFAWLDEVIGFAVDAGLNVLLETSYGNPVYPGAGGWDLGAGFPSSSEGLAAWDRWVEILATRYRGKVRDWAMWNEPDIHNPANPLDAGEKTPEQIAAFNVRTAKIIRRIIPDARLAGLSLARIHEPEFFERCLKAMGPDVALFDWMIHHGYAEAPESSYAHLDKLSAILRKYNPKATMRQGENGCPSEYASRFALSGPAWSEYSQAKWDLRRMLGDLGHGFESSVFTICDFNHTGREINRKGLLRATDTHQVISVKRAYYAVQNLVSIFDDTVTLAATPSVTNVDATVVLNEYRRGDAPVYVFWTAADFKLRDRDTYKPWVERTWLRPNDSFTTRPTVLTVAGEPLVNPVWVDLLTGRVYEFPATEVHFVNGQTIYTNVPVYDSPCLLTASRAIQR